MADARQLEILKNGVQLWNKWAWFEPEIMEKIVEVFGKRKDKDRWDEFEI